jgi:NAD(P)-dependent dehydrogenase (short-subunit alcohol dehydrogenase family)
MLQNKTAVIYGAGGSLGGAVAKAFAAAGANVFLTGRSLLSVQKVHDEITAADGQATVAEVDAFDENAVQTHLQQVLATTGSVDICFNAVGVDVVQNKPLTDISLYDFLQPVTLNMHTRFLTAKAAAQIMMKQGSGVILSLTATPGGIGYPYTGGFAPACSAIETFSKNLAAELGIYGIRVVNIRSGGSPDSKVFKDAVESMPEAMGAILHGMRQDTMLKKMPLMADIANAAVFLCSDMAGRITGVTVDVTCGTTAGLNYRVNQPTFGQPL